MQDLGLRSKINKKGLWAEPAILALSIMQKGEVQYCVNRWVLLAVVTYMYIQNLQHYLLGIILS